MRVILAILSIVFFDVGAVILMCIPSLGGIIPIGTILVLIAIFLFSITLSWTLDELINGQVGDEKGDE